MRGILLLFLAIGPMASVILLEGGPGVLDLSSTAYGSKAGRST